MYACVYTHTTYYVLDIILRVLKYYLLFKMIPYGSYYFPQFIDEETKTQKTWMACPKLHNH